MNNIMLMNNIMMSNIEKSCNLKIFLKINFLTTEQQIWLLLKIHTIFLVSRLLLFRFSVAFDCLRPHGLQHPSLPSKAPIKMIILSVSCSSKWNENLQTFMKHSEYRMHLDFNCLQICYLLHLYLFLPIVFIEYFQKIFHILTLLISELNSQEETSMYILKRRCTLLTSVRIF